MKEELLEQLKALIKEVVEDDIYKDAEKFGAWQRRFHSIRELVANLPPEGFEWLDKEYKIWFNANLREKTEEALKRIQETISENTPKV